MIANISFPDAAPLFEIEGMGWVVAGIEAIVIVCLLVKLALLHRRRVPDHLGLVRNSSPGSKQSELASLFDKALTGSLDRFSVSDVIQFVNAIQETGILDISGGRSGAVRRVLFDSGEIVDAYDGMHHGENAVREILNNSDGSFTFIRGEIPPCDNTINKPTMTILMEQMQAYDEDGDEDGARATGLEMRDEPVFR
jgi:hypothetical protein